VSRLPIRLRVTLIFTGVMALVLGATGLFVYLRLEAQLDQTINRDLRSRATDIAALIRVSDRGLGEPARSGLKQREESGFAQVLTPSGRTFDRPAQPHGRPVLDPTEVQEAADASTYFERSGAPGVRKGPVRLLGRPINFEGKPLIVVVGESLADRNDALQNLATLLLLGGPVALLFASLAAYGTVAAALRPVEAMRARAAEISGAEADQRLPVPPAQDELHRLGETLNEMLDRLRAAVERERAFVDDASHELRTPLALHKTELELALRYAEGTEQLRAAIGSAIAESDRLSRLAEDLLVLARADKGRLSIDVKPVGVEGLFAGVRKRLSGTAQEAGRSLVFDDPDGLVIEGDRTRVEQALTNLVDNALRYGEGPIRLWARPTDEGVELHVTDDGPGFPTDFLPHAFERFRRVDAARAEGGTGLGLAIVEAIARAHRGRAGARNAPQGGADVWIELGRAV
jgi:two-component system OmpR family sensor kinase